MIDLPSVCIMIPTYNQANYVTKAVESALAQDYPNIKIVIADDNSTDCTEEILQPFISHPKIIYKKNAVNLGRVANYKKCLFEYASADWVINLDGDDYYTNPQFISQAMQAIQKTGIENTLFYQGVNILKSDRTEKVIEPKIIGDSSTITGKTYFLNYFERKYFSHMSTLYNRKLGIETDFYSLDIISSDIFSFLNLCLQFSGKNIIVSKNISGVWLQHENNSSKTRQVKQHYNNFTLYRKLYRLAIKKLYNKWTCVKWVVKAGFYYIRSFINNY